MLTTKDRHPVHQDYFDRDATAQYWREFHANDGEFYGHVLGFKGLERSVVVLCVNGFKDLGRAAEQLYVGLSRARSLLVVVGGSTMFGQALLNSQIVAGTTTVFALVLGVFAAYAISRLNFRFKSVILGVIIATSMFPGISVVVPLLRLFTDIGWINTYQAMIVPNLSFAIPLAVWNLTTFMKALPFDLEEAAMIDGCTRWQAFRRVLLPLAAPGVVTTAILTFIHSWNEFIIALSMINDPKIQTARAAISKFTGATEFQAPFGEQMAAGVIVTVPLVIMVLIFQRRIVEGLTAGARK
jgi:multiple sugar transport system permease protein